MSGPVTLPVDGGALSQAAGETLLEVRNLSTHYFTAAGVVRAVENVSFSMAAGETMGLVGESGCGKSNTALSIARLVRKPGRIVAGQVRFEGRDLLRLPERQMRRLRGRKIGTIFQDPMSSLNPLHTVGHQIAETVSHNLGRSRREAWERAVELLDMVGISRPRERARAYPHQFSGGMRQRVMVAIAIACGPRLLLADEPTTALDVTIQAQILNLINELSAEVGAAVLLITHDLGVAAGMCDRIAVMYAGQIVEMAGADDLFEQPRMPYTRGLLDSLPRRDRDHGALLTTIEGLPPDGTGPTEQCQFAPRCRFARDACWEAEPPLSFRAEGTGGDAHLARCLGTEPGGWIGDD